MEHEVDNYTNHDWCFLYSHQRIIDGNGGIGGRRTSGDHPNYSIIENSQNTEKSPGDLRRLAVTQTLSSKKTLVKTDLKNSQGENNKIIEPYIVIISVYCIYYNTRHCHDD